MKKFKKILGSVFTIGIVLAVGVLAVNAYFSDEETSTGNIFQAGAVNLEIDNITHNYNGGLQNAPVWNLDSDVMSFTLNDLKPLDNGAITYTLDNTDNEVHLCVLVNDTTPEPEANDTAFASMMHFLFGSQSGQVSSIAGVWQSLGVLPAKTSAPYSVGYCFGIYDGTTCVLDDIDYNPAQNGMMQVDVEFYAVQTRNNPSFDCSSLNDQGPEVGANLSLYKAPENCTGSPIATNAIQSTIDSAADNDVICVEIGEFSGTVVVDRPLTLASLSGPLTSATIQNGVHIKSSNVTLTGFIINPGVILGENIAVYLDGGISDVTVSFNDLNGNSESPSRGVLTVTSGAYSNVMIVDNFIHNFVTGIYTNPGTNSIVVRYNDIYDNTAGIGGYTGAHVIYNEFSSAGEAMGVDGSYDNSVVEYNNFLSGAMLNNYDGGVTVSAPNNFWNISGATQTFGNVNYTPEAGAQYTHR